MYIFQEVQDYLKVMSTCKLSFLLYFYRYFWTYMHIFVVIPPMYFRTYMYIFTPQIICIHVDTWLYIINVSITIHFVGADYSMLPCPPLSDNANVTHDIMDQCDDDSPELVRISQVPGININWPGIDRVPQNNMLFLSFEAALVILHLPEFMFKLCL